LVKILNDIRTERSVISDHLNRSKFNKQYFRHLDQQKMISNQQVNVPIRMNKWSKMQQNLAIWEFLDGLCMLILTIIAVAMGGKIFIFFGHPAVGILISISVIVTGSLGVGISICSCRCAKWLIIIYFIDCIFGAIIDFVYFLTLIMLVAMANEGFWNQSGLSWIIFLLILTTLEDMVACIVSSGFICRGWCSGGATSEIGVVYTPNGQAIGEQDKVHINSQMPRTQMV